MNNECIHPTKSIHKVGTAMVLVAGKPVSMNRVVYARHYRISVADMKGKRVSNVCPNKWCINPLHMVCK